MRRRTQGLPRPVEWLEPRCLLKNPADSLGFCVCWERPQSCFWEELSKAEIGFGGSLLSGTELWTAVSVKTKPPMWVQGDQVLTLWAGRTGSASALQVSEKC